jgi:hypothetical protein
VAKPACPCCTCIHRGDVVAGCAVARKGNAVQAWIKGWEPRGDTEHHGGLFVCPPSVHVDPCPGWRSEKDDGQGTLFGAAP